MDTDEQEDAHDPLSKQEIEKLRKNPYVASVTANTVRFTEAFKELAYEKKSQGIPVMETSASTGSTRDSRSQPRGRLLLHT